MPGSRARLACVTAVAAALVLGARAQEPASRSIVKLGGLGLPAVDVGVMADETHAPDAPEARRRIALGSTLRTAGDTRSAPYVPGRLLVKFRDAASPVARLSALRAVTADGTIGRQPEYADFTLVSVPQDEDVPAVARRLAVDHGDVVEYAQPSYRVHTMMRPNDPLYATRQWNLPLINIEPAWDIQPQAGSDIVVAVLDTGLAYEDATLVVNIPAFRDEMGTRYPALGRVTLPFSAARQVVPAANPGRIVSPHDFIWDDDEPLDFDGHGTHVSGTIGQVTNDNVGTAGVAFNVKLMPVKVIDNTWDLLFGAPHEATDEVVAQGVRWAADHGARIINMSIGRSGPPAPALEAAFNYAVGRGAFIVVAAGNEFEDGNPLEVLAEICSRVKGAVSVGAVDPNKARAYYSSTGSWVELAAPGGSNRGFGSTEHRGFVWQQTYDFNFTDTFLLPPSQYHAPRFDVLGYIGYIGTSMATPHVTGLAAMLMQQGIGSPAAIEDALERFAIDLGDNGRDNQFGYGLIDARTALRGLGLAK